MGTQNQDTFAGDWEFSEDFYNEYAGERELSLEDFMDDASPDLNEGPGLPETGLLSEEIRRVSGQVGQVILMSGQGKCAAEIAAALGEEEQYVKDIMVCVQAFPEDSPVAVARLMVMG